MKVACIIPARLKSTRFPRKILSMLQGKPLLQWVWDAARSVSVFDEVAFAIDSEEAAQLITTFQGKYFMTPESCVSGTDRLAYLQSKGGIDADIWVNWQADEPFIGEIMIRDLLQTAGQDGSDVWTLKKKIVSPAEVESPHFAKVVCDHKGYALYFSRSPIPCYRDVADFAHQVYFKHVGLYAFTRVALKKISTLHACPIEEAEQLEQLRFLFNGLRIRVHETQHEVVGIDLPEHLAAAEMYIKNFIS